MIAGFNLWQRERDGDREREWEWQTDRSRKADDGTTTCDANFLIYNNKNINQLKKIK